MGQKKNISARRYASEKKPSESEVKKSVSEAECIVFRRYASDMVLSQKGFCHRSKIVYRQHC
jgi:hypothetical protein